MPTTCLSPLARFVPRLVRYLPATVLCFFLLPAVPGKPAIAGTDAGDRRLAEQIVVVRCSLCHGLDGQSVSPLYPKLAGQNAEYIIKQIFNFKTGQRSSTVMGDVANTLSAADTRRLADYFASLPITPHPPEDPELAAVGRFIYFRGNPYTGVSACVSCHGVDATGGAQMPRLAGQHAAYLERQLNDFRSKARGNDQSMHGVIQAMTEFETKAVTQYLAGQE